MDGTILKQRVTEEAKRVGFDLVGFSAAEPDSRSVKVFNEWLDKNFEGDMEYMRRSEEREHPEQVLPGAKTVITLSLNYYQKQEPLRRGNGRIARYAHGKNYHKLIEKRLKRMKQSIQELIVEADIKGYVDTGPLLERSFAVQSGMGNIGKNGCLITKEYGSWVLLGELITTLEIPPDKKHDEAPFSICGDCDLCMKACPTGAIVAPGVIDSRKCISYQTIENKGEVPQDVADLIGRTRRVFGCDICQEVCPKNDVQKQTTDEAFNTPIAGDQIPLKEIIAIPSDEAFLNRFAGSAVMRAKRKVLQRSARLAIENNS